VEVIRTADKFLIGTIEVSRTDVNGEQCGVWQEGAAEEPA
jgi:hypothetical protein